MSTTFVIATLIVVAVLVYLARLPGSYEVRRSRLVNCDPQTLFDKVRDFKSWPDWSPWLIHEPDCKLVYSDSYDEEGGYYDWDGQYIGAGRLTHVKFTSPRRMEQKINFFRPFKSEADVTFEFAEKNGGTEITWIMQGKMPLPFRFMIPRIVVMISKDYDFGLARLGGIMDANAEHPVISFEGECEFENRHVICRHFEGHMDDMIGFLKEGFPAMMEFAVTSNLAVTSAPFVAYHKVDLKKQHFSIDMALPVAEGSDAGGYETKHLGGGRYYRTVLQGSYGFLEIAWHEVMGHMQMRKIKVDRSRPSFEVYENDPADVRHSNECRTSIYVPIKS